MWGLTCYWGKFIFKVSRKDYTKESKRPWVYKKTQGINFCCKSSMVNITSFMWALYLIKARNDTKGKKKMPLGIRIRGHCSGLSSCFPLCESNTYCKYFSLYPKSSKQKRRCLSLRSSNSLSFKCWPVKTFTIKNVCAPTGVSGGLGFVTLGSVCVSKLNKPRLIVLPRLWVTLSLYPQKRCP